jgi:heme-degrading monooxygenase HmoA
MAMPVVISRRTLAENDFEGWRSRFESAAPARAAAGCRGVRRFRSVDCPNEVIVVFDWDTHENARAFIEGNIQSIQARNPNDPAPGIETLYVEELTPLAS